MDTVKITFNDGTIHEYIKGTSYYDISKDYNICQYDSKNII